jgi:hypothetical protein
MAILDCGDNDFVLVEGSEAGLKVLDVLLK